MPFSTTCTTSPSSSSTLARTASPTTTTSRCVLCRVCPPLPRLFHLTGLIVCIADAAGPCAALRQRQCARGHHGHPGPPRARKEPARGRRRRIPVCPSPRPRGRGPGPGPSPGAARSKAVKARLSISQAVSGGSPRPACAANGPVTARSAAGADVQVERRLARDCGRRSEDAGRDGVAHGQEEVCQLGGPGTQVCF
jgi:hypothetical protein